MEDTEELSINSLLLFLLILQLLMFMSTLNLCPSMTRFSSPATRGANRAEGASQAKVRSVLGDGAISESVTSSV